MTSTPDSLTESLALHSYVFLCICGLGQVAQIIVYLPKKERPNELLSAKPGHPAVGSNSEQAFGNLEPTLGERDLGDDHLADDK
jgi:hypothetical protein